MFLIRARDQVAVPAIRAWAALHEAAGGDPAIAEVARRHAEAVERWQLANGCKAADLP